MRQSKEPLTPLSGAQTNGKQEGEAPQTSDAQMKDDLEFLDQQIQEARDRASKGDVQSAIMMRALQKFRKRVENGEV